MPTPIAASFRAVFVPIPQSASVGRGPIHPVHLSEVSAKTPAGFPASVAIFAWSLLSPIPIEHQSSVRSRSRALHLASERLGFIGLDRDDRLIHPITWTTKPKDRSVSITRREASK